MGTLTIRPLTRADIDKMNSPDFLWHTTHNAANVELALNPPPPPAPPTEAELRSKKAAAMAKELTTEYKQWLLEQNIATPNELAWEQFLEERNAIKAIESEVGRFLKAHPEYKPLNVNRQLIDGWLADQSLPVTCENLEKAFQAIKGDLILDETKSLSPNRVETRPGQWKNGQFIPFVTATDENIGTSQEKTYLFGQADPSKIAGGELDVRRNPRNMSAEEFARACQQSPTFRKRMNESPV